MGILQTFDIYSRLSRFSSIDSRNQARTFEQGFDGEFDRAGLGFHGLRGVILLQEFLNGFGASAGGVGLPGVVRAGRIGQVQIRSAVHIEAALNREEQSVMFWKCLTSVPAQNG